MNKAPGSEPDLYANGNVVFPSDWTETETVEWRIKNNIPGRGYEGIAAPERLSKDAAAGEGETK